MKSIKITTILILAMYQTAHSQTGNNYLTVSGTQISIIITFVSILALLGVVWYAYIKFKKIAKNNFKQSQNNIYKISPTLNAKQIDSFLNLKNENCCGTCKNNSTACTKIKSTV